jgi:PRTRC genetic system protein E
MSLFTLLSRALNAKGSRLDFEMIAIGDGQLRIRMTPNLGPTPENATKEELQLRAYLATPMTLNGTAEGIEELLEQKLKERLDAQNIGVPALNRLQEKMLAASAAADNAQPAASAKKASASTAKTATADGGEEAAEPAKVQRVADKPPSMDDF